MLSVAAQCGAAHVWALVNPAAGMVKRRFRIAGTGHPISDEDSQHTFIGTVMLVNGTLVLHVFDLGEAD